MELSKEDYDLIFNSIRDIKDFPKEGIVFKDITTLLNNSEAFSVLMNHLSKRYATYNLDFIAGIDSRGFIFGAALAYMLGIGFVPIRKKGKLPAQTLSASYELEYGTDSIEIHKDAFLDKNNPKILLIDDLIATGGTATAAAELIKQANGDLIESCFLIELGFLDGAKKLKEHSNIYSVIKL